MCKDCGCESALHHHHHDHDDHHHDKAHHQEHHHHDHIEIGAKVLAANDRYAQMNRDWFRRQKMIALNMISSPGSGKTALLERTLQDLQPELRLCVLVGDQATQNDAERLRHYQVPVKQINTISSCHLDAHMIGHELEDFVPPETQLLIIENVGNLVCPAVFDLGENHKVALLSTPEGEDKPEKYPVLFHEADIILVTKSDLIPYLDWNQEKCLNSIRKVNPMAPVIFLSVKSGQGLADWYQYLKNQIQINNEVSTTL